MLPRIVAVAVLLFTFLSNLGWSQMIVAHRGASYDAPENTLAAFRLAWQQQSDGIEGDFYLTADRQIVCIHDADTERTGGRKLMVEQSTLDQLRELEFGQWKDPKWHGEPIPTFQQVWDTVPDGKLFVIELKSKQSIAPVLAEQLQRLNDGRIRIMIISFDQLTVAACKELLPDSRIHWLTSFKEDESGGGFQPTADRVAETVRRLGVEGVGMKAERGIIDAAFADALRGAQCREFHVWTVDSVDDAKYFQSLGAVGITTNRPGEIRSALRNR
jgi:glycerophosphoryl diester phosphodiesterase